ncbi:MAG: PspC domain-containing protein [Acidobacteriota bacterium]
MSCSVRSAAFNWVIRSRTFARHAGTSFHSPRPGFATPRRLTRSRRDRKISGVCGGIAEYMNVDPTLIRLLAVISFFCGAGLLAYIVPGWFCRRRILLPSPGGVPI